MNRGSLHKRLGDNYIWGLKYRPNDVESLILPERIKKQIQQMIDSKNIPNLLFSGPAGCGKTSTGVVLSEMLDFEYLYINGSEQNGIDVLRTKIRQFVTGTNWDNNKKIVILDECLEENEEILVGTLEENYKLKLKEFEVDKEYDLISFNMKTGQYENDRGKIISEREAEVFEIVMDDGRTIRVTDNHPFIIKDSNGKFIEKTILDGLNEDDEIVDYNEKF